MRLINHVRPTSRLFLVAGVLFVLGNLPADSFGQNSKSTDQPKTQQPVETPTGQDGIEGGNNVEAGSGSRGGHRRNGFGRANGRGFLAGVYDLKIEIKPGADDEAIQVFLDGEPVDASTAAFFLRIIRQKKMRAWRNRTRRGGTDPGNQAAVHSPGPPDGAEAQTDFSIGRASGSPERIDEVMLVVRDFDPNMYGRLMQLQRSGNDQRFATEIDRLATEYAGEIRLRRRDEEGYGLRVKDRQLETDLQALQFEIGMVQPKDDSAISEYRHKVSELLMVKFDIQQQMRDRELTKMVSRLDGLKERLKERAGQRDQYVEERTEEIFRELLMGDH